MYIKSFVAIVAFAATLPVLYEHLRILPFFYYNSPHRLISINSFANYEIKFADRIRSCEDVLLVEDRQLALIACDAGRERWNTVMGVFLPGEVANAELFAYDYRSNAAEEDSLKAFRLVNFPSAHDFHTLGMDFDPNTSILLVSNHAKAGPRIEMFKLDFGAMTATYQRTIQHPLIIGPNSIHMINPVEFYVTNDHQFPMRQFKQLALLETYLSTPTGRVVHVKISDAETEARVVARVPFANGITALNSSTVAVSATSRGAVYLFEKTALADLRFRSKIRLPFFPDNLSTSGDKLLIAGHPHMPALGKYTHTRHICNDVEQLKYAEPVMKQYCAEGKATSWVSEWSEAEGLKHLYVGTDYPTSATAVKDAKRGVGIVSGLYAKGILIWGES